MVDEATQFDGRKNNPSLEAAKNHVTEKALRFAFVAFLFSFTMGRLALNAYPAVEGMISSGLSAQQVARLFHLTVAFLAITFSWVYWSKKAWDDKQLDDVLTWNYFILVIDVFLVVLYFFIVESADSLAEGQMPSARPESILLACVYFTYLSWDFLHDIIYEPRMRPKSKKRRTIPVRIWNFIWASLVRCYASALSTLLAIFVVFIARSIEPTLQARATPIVLVVVLLNCAEIANLVVFRTVKLGEDCLHVKVHKLSKQYWQPRRFGKDGESKKHLRRHRIGLIVSIVSYIAAFVGVLLVVLSANSS